MRRFFDLLSEGTGLYNMGWLPDSGGDFNEGQRMLVEKVVTPLKKQTGMILEAGSGQGGPAKIARTILPGRIVGLELLSGQLTEAVKVAGVAQQFIRGDACQMSFGKCAFSGVYCIESAFHYPDKAAFVREVARVLKSGGIFSLADMMRKPSGSRFLTRLVARGFGSPGFFTRQDYQLVAAEAGLEMIHCEDLTPGVAKSFKSAASYVLNGWGELRREYPSWMLTAFILMGKSLRFIHRLGPVEYRWLVFRKT